MSELPKLDPEQFHKALSQRLSKENFELITQVVSLEIMATALRDERDEAREELQSLKGGKE